jgi:hypothetical protein
MKMLITRDSGCVTINGRTAFVDCVSIQPEIDQVKWFDDQGTVHYRDSTVVEIGDITAFRVVIDLWNEKQNVRAG